MPICECKGNTVHRNGKQFSTIIPKKIILENFFGQHKTQAPDNEVIIILFGKLFPNKMR